MIKIWQSYSCNNSSSFRMVARFADPAVVPAVVAELEEFFAVHAGEVDGRDHYTDDPSEASIELGKKYGFDWNDLLYWGSGGMSGDMPDLFVEGDVLIVQHTYCGGGFGTGLPTYLEKRGANVGAESESDIPMSLLFRPSSDPYLDDELAKLFSQTAEHEPGDLRVEPFVAPWTIDHDAYGDFSYFRDAGTVGLHFPIDPRDLDNVKGWLRIRGIERPVIRLDVRDDAIDFDEIRKARCRSCNGALEYLDPALHDIESKQLVCRPCGGFYDLSAFVPPPRKS